MTIATMIGKLDAITLPAAAGVETWEQMKTMTPVDMAIAVVFDELEESGNLGDIGAQVRALFSKPEDPTDHAGNWTQLCDIKTAQIAVMKEHLEGLQ